jgi:Transposase family tnp2.
MLTTYSFRVADDLSEMDKLILRAFTLKVKSHMTDDAYEKLSFVFPSEPLPSWKETKSRTAFLSGIDPILYDCCPSSCCCYTGPNASLDKCPHCHMLRYNPDGQPKKKFVYIPLIPRLVAFFKNPDLAEKMKYRGHEHIHNPGNITDIHDGSVYRELLDKPVVVDGKELRHKYFSDSRDVALGLSTDGFAPFRRRKRTAWPLLLFNYNLPPELRFLAEYIICLGIIPGPKKPKDCDSFLWPVIEELLRLAVGVRAYDVLLSSLFALRAYIIVASGDIPAISMLMRIKGHNGFSPCRACKITGVRVPGSRAATYYVPLDRSRHPDIRNSASATKKYDADNLPLRTHLEMLEQGREVQLAKTTAESERLSKQYGIKGVPILSYLPSLSFPASFPYDFMHLIWENLIPNLVLLWTGDFKGVDQGRESYELGKNVWEAIGEATATSGNTLPSTFCARPPNVAGDHSGCTADSWSFWTLYLAPVLLHKKFLKRKYYDHFVELVKLLHICLQFELSRDDVKALRVGFNMWVQKYEVYVS